MAFKGNIEMARLAKLESEKKYSAGGELRIFLSKGAKILLLLLAVRLLFKAVFRCFAGCYRAEAGNETPGAALF